jgi:hypothetical protein
MPHLPACPSAALADSPRAAVAFVRGALDVVGPNGVKLLLAAPMLAAPMPAAYAPLTSTASFVKEHVLPELDELAGPGA